MSVKMKPTSVIKARLGLNPGGEVQKFFTRTCMIHMDKYVPYGTSELHLKENVTEGDDYIQYNSPYAHYMYKGELYVDAETGSAWARKDSTKIPTGKPLNYHEPGTGPYWDKRMWSAEEDDVIDEVQNFMRR